MNHLGLELVDRVAHHHSYEDSTVLPQFLSLFPEMEAAVDLLENDHHVLDDALNASREVFLNLIPEHSSKAMIAKALAQAKELNRILNRHTYDEEDYLMPPLLNSGATL